MGREDFAAVATEKDLESLWALQPVSGAFVTDSREWESPIPFANSSLPDFPVEKQQCLRCRITVTELQ